MILNNRYHSIFKNEFLIQSVFVPSSDVSQVSECAASERSGESADSPCDSLRVGGCGGGDGAGNPPPTSPIALISLYYGNGWRDGITVPVNQRGVLDNLIHFSRVVLAGWQAQNCSAGTKFAINLPRPCHLC